MTRFAALVLVCFAVSVTTFATSYGPPLDREICSPNGLFLLRIHARSGKHEVFGANSPSRRKPLWSFVRHVWHDECFVSDDGNSVVWVAWQFVKKNDLQTNAIEVWSSQGLASQASYSKVGDVRPLSRGEVGPIGDFWRVWRADCAWENGLVVIKHRKGTISVDPASCTITRSDASRRVSEPVR